MYKQDLNKNTKDNLSKNNKIIKESITADIAQQLYNKYIRTMKILENK